ncbi:hypothetical protein EIP91_001709 [Steccherinum ochraceum]|uniref:F-box domain-containing protein n=1 Tax=Steccherinum ochraceum TaxID=92696 RepID=A0A4R0RJS9_9APHY|nr:hypothetical protein EIP91_001709 [Steccherinum ochraceum]
MATLSSLPNELLIAILSEVAGDVSAGHITTTVSRVSKSFHHLIQSTGIDVHYAFLRGIGNMQKFLDVLQLRDMAQRRVHSLLVVVDRDQDIPLENATSDEYTLSLLQTILSNDTPMLHIPISLPALTTLHLSGLITIPPSPTNTFSSLTDIQLLRLSSLPQKHQNIPQLLRTLAPNVRQVKLTFYAEARAMTGWLVLSFMDLLKAFRTRSGSLVKAYPTQTHAFPNSLARIVICYPTPDAEYQPWFATVWRSFEATVDATAHLSDGAVKPAVVVLSASDLGREGEERQKFVDDWMRLNVGEVEEV